MEVERVMIIAEWSNPLQEPFDYELSKGNYLFSLTQIIKKMKCP